MVVITPSELRNNQKKYFDLAENERVVIKRGRKVIELVVTEKIGDNPSPSGDKWFDSAENLNELKKRIAKYEANKTGTKLESKEDIKALFEKL